MKANILFITATLLLSSNVFAAELPEFKPGLWELDTTTEGVSEGITKQCMDAETSKSIMKSTSKMMGKNCGETKIDKQGNTYVSKIECKIAGSQMVSSSKLSGDFKTNFTAESKTSFSPALMGTSNSSSVTKGKWLGECEKGMKPGDTILPDGKKINIHDAMDNMPQMDELMDMQNQFQDMMNKKMGNQ